MTDTTKKKKRTALITGASLGIGRALALRFAKDGHDVVLVARSKPKLNELAKELEAKGVSARVVAVDLAADGAVDAIASAVKGVDVDYLVNNAGFGSNGEFVDLPLATELAMIDLNCRVLVELCHVFGKQMRDRKSGRIMNIASTAGFLAGPYMSTYYATKNFVVAFSEGLDVELRPHGVSVTCHCPGATATNFASAAGADKSGLFKAGAAVAGVDDVADHAYAAMMRGAGVSVHGLMNWIGAHVGSLAPRAVPISLAARMNRTKA